MEGPRAFEKQDESKADNRRTARKKQEEMQVVASDRVNTPTRSGFAQGRYAGIDLRTRGRWV